MPSTTTIVIGRRGRFLMDFPCSERLQTSQMFPKLHSQTFTDVINDTVEFVRSLQENGDLQKWFVSMIDSPHRDLLKLSQELVKVQRRLESGSTEREESASFLELLSSSSSVARSQAKALCIATEAFRELMAVSVDRILSLTSEEVSNLFILFQKIPVVSSAHTFSNPAPSDSDPVFYQLLSRIGFTGWKGHLMYQRQSGCSGLDLVTLTVIAIHSVTPSHSRHILH